MTATLLPITVEQGATYFLKFIWANDEEGLDPIPMAGAVLRMQVRKTQQATVLIDASSEGPTPEITFGDSNGIIEVKLPAALTSLLTVKSALYDMEATMSNGDVHRVVKGPVTIDPNITQTTGEPVLGP